MRPSKTKYILTIFLAFTNLFSYSQPPAGYAFGKQILIQSAQVSGASPLVNFPILVSFTDPDLRTVANGGNVENASGFDILFTDDANCAVLLDHQLEKYEPTTGEYLAWVRIPSLPSTTDLGIRMYYSNPAAVTDPSTTATWNANYIGVWHMSEDPSGAAPQIADFTAGTSNGTSNGTMTTGDLVNGRLGNAIDFDGTDDFIEIGDVLIDGLTQITVEAWINSTSLTVNASPSGHNANEGAIVHKNGGSDDNLGITVTSTATAFYIDDGSNNTPTAGAPPVGNWMHIVGTWDNSIMTIYQNGVSTATLGSVAGAFVNNNNSLRFGGVHGGAGGNPHSFNGIIDEIRISNTSRSADWIATEFNNQNSPATFYTVSAELAATNLCATLPIELLNFSAKAFDKNRVLLNWQTSSEINNDYFTIEKSKDGVNWKFVQNVNGAGNSSTKLDYSVTDYSPYSGLSYYRLKQTDFDGQFDYSSLRSVNIQLEENSSLTIYPNPSNNKITIRGDQVQIEDISILNSLGQNVIQLTKFKRQSEKTVLIDLSNLSEGLYFIKTKTTVAKFYKQ